MSPSTEPRTEDSATSTPLADLTRLRRDLDELHGLVRLLMIALILTTAGLGLFMYRQSQLLRFQIMAQQTAVTEAAKQQEPILAALPVFQAIGIRHPDYASNVLQKFNLSVLVPTNAAGASRR